MGVTVGAVIEDTADEGRFGDEDPDEVGVFIDELDTLQADIRSPIRHRYKIVLAIKRLMPIPAILLKSSLIWSLASLMGVYLAWETTLPKTSPE